MANSVRGVWWKECLGCKTIIQNLNFCPDCSAALSLDSKRYLVGWNGLEVRWFIEYESYLMGKADREGTSDE